jgi:peptidyl-prolyl cis-trans isomerase C
MPPAAAAARIENVPKPAQADNSKLSPEQAAVVVARIGTREITLGELERKLMAEPPVVRSQFASVQKRKDYLQKLVQFEVLAQEAARQGLDKDPEVLDALQQALVKRYLATQGMGGQGMGGQGNDETDPAKIPEADLRAYYDHNPQVYHRPEMVEVSHILLKDKAKADQVRQELQAGSEGNTAKLVALWNDYVVRVSEDEATKSYLGALGLVGREVPKDASPAEIERRKAIPQALVEAAFALQPFQLGPVVASERGFHVVMVTSRSVAVDQPFAEVKDSIRQRIAKRERDLRRQQLLDTLRKSAKVTVNDDAVRLIVPPEAEVLPKLPKVDGIVLPPSASELEGRP